MHRQQAQCELSAVRTPPLHPRSKLAQSQSIHLTASRTVGSSPSGPATLAEAVQGAQNEAWPAQQTSPQPFRRSQRLRPLGNTRIPSHPPPSPPHRSYSLPRGHTASVAHRQQTSSPRSLALHNQVRPQGASCHCTASRHTHTRPRRATDRQSQGPGDWSPGATHHQQRQGQGRPHLTHTHPHPSSSASCPSQLSQHHSCPSHSPRQPLSALQQPDSPRSSSPTPQTLPSSISSPSQR